ncbi:MAG TPA: hypothetical protein PLE59_07045 [Bacteroidales bacterium]|nr:hypothetical protein [Bacteroidales bacterium]HPL03254.1 hypothetical protein [Bacteroidales bacterium]
MCAEKILFTETELNNLMNRYHFSEEMIDIVKNENLLPLSLLSRLQTAYPQYSLMKNPNKIDFNEKDRWVGLKGFREIVDKLAKHGVIIDKVPEREVFIHVYRFMVTAHVLNLIDWDNYQNDPLFYLTFPQPDMVREHARQKILAAKTDEEREAIVKDYIKETNPHDGKQKLNKPTYINENGELELLDGLQHKYSPVVLILDEQTQNCFGFCTYCFRHAQVRGDEDMFAQKSIEQVIGYLKRHKEITDILITGGDAGYITPARYREYIIPIIEDPELSHIRTVRLGTRVLSYYPEKILSHKYDEMLNLFKLLYDNGVQPMIVSHFSTPREIMNITTIAAIRRLKSYGVNLKSQSPIMNHISMYEDENGNIDVDRSAQNWIDLGNIFAMLGVGFHAMYIPRPTGEVEYFTRPLADINKVFNKIYKSLASVNRPSRYITMTLSAGKISLLGDTKIDNDRIFALKINEGRDMNWCDNVFFAEYDEQTSNIANLKPYKADKFFYEDELEEIENNLEKNILEAQKHHKISERK